MFVAFLVISCTEENPIGSEITYYPNFEIIGGEIMNLEIGDVYTEPGVIATTDQGELDVTISGNVDTSKAGVYTLTYSATNNDGFDGSTKRTVVVFDDFASIAQNDLSGNYSASWGSGRPVVITKISDGFYKIDDLLPYNKISASFYQVSSTQVIIPSTSSGFGTILADSSINPATSGVLSGNVITLKTAIGGGVYAVTYTKN